MITAVVPVCNEEHSIKKVMNTILNIPVDKIIPVLNGCRDRSAEIIKALGSSVIDPLFFNEPLGIDVPRAVGAKQAYDLGSDIILFIDGDMEGVKADHLRQLILSVKLDKVDLALSNCYPANFSCTPSPLASFVISIRKKLNLVLKLENIGTATPSHGPHAVSRRLLEVIPFQELAVPPVMLALSAKHNFKISIASEIPHPELGSPAKGPVHSQRIAETIIGDTLEAINFYQRKARCRVQKGIIYIGYHQERRWDLMNIFLSGNKKNR